MGKTSIQWTDQSWPVVNGCRRVSAGCGKGREGGCYAERLIATRLRNHPKYKGLAVMGAHGPKWTAEARLWEPHLDMPLRLKKPSRIFVCDMGDLFFEAVPDEWIDHVYAVMANASRHTFQVLTKRPARMAIWTADSDRPAKVRDAATKAGLGTDFAWPLPNVWAGTSIEDQATADERVPELLFAPAALHYVSYEPALAAASLAPWLRPSAVGWVIVGGESGPRARPFQLEWARSVVAECRNAGVAPFVKQLGTCPMEGSQGLPLTDRKGGNAEEWPADLKVREWPTPMETTPKTTP